MKNKYGQWYLLTGLVMGAFAGLLIAWILQPVEYIDTSPASLQAAYKDHYRLLIAAAYAANGDLVRAKARLELLEDDDILQALTEQAQRTLAEGNSPEEARALGLLALALGQSAPGPAVVITPNPNAASSAPSLGPPGFTPSPPVMPGGILTSTLTLAPALTQTDPAP